MLQSLREKLRCKEIWVEGADRYRNPDEDVPSDFSEKREEILGSALPLEAEEFHLRSRKSEAALQQFE